MEIPSIIHISNLSPEITIDEIYSTYSKSGTIEKIILGRQEALVFFDDEDDAESAQVLNCIGDVEVEVSIAITRTLEDTIQTIDYTQHEESTNDVVKSNVSSSANDYEVITQSQIKEEQLHVEQPRIEHVEQVVVEEAKQEVNVVQEQAQDKEELPERIKEMIHSVDQQNYVQQSSTITDSLKTSVTEAERIIEHEQPKVEEQRHAVVEEPKQVVVEEPVQKVVELPQTVVVEEPKRAQVEEPVRTQVEEPKKTLVEEPKPVEKIQQVEVKASVVEPVRQKVEEKTEVHSSESQVEVCTIGGTCTIGGSCSINTKSCPIGAGSSTSVDSVQLLKALRNTSLPERSKPTSEDVFQNVFNPNFLSGLIGLLIAITIFSQIF